MVTPGSFERAPERRVVDEYAARWRPVRGVGCIGRNAVSGVDRCM